MHFDFKMMHIFDDLQNIYSDNESIIRGVTESILSSVNKALFGKLIRNFHLQNFIPCFFSKFHPMIFKHVPMIFKHVPIISQSILVSKTIYNQQGRI